MYIRCTGILHSYLRRKQTWCFLRRYCVLVKIIGASYYVFSTVESICTIRVCKNCTVTCAGTLSIGSILYYDTDTLLTITLCIVHTCSDNCLHYHIIQGIYCYLCRYSNQVLNIPLLMYACKGILMLNMART